MSIAIKNRIIDLSTRIDEIKREVDSLTVDLNKPAPVEKPAVKAPKAKTTKKEA